jgi:Na+-transporting NADH:ubiquinone oxidoreductase subunit B
MADSTILQRVRGIVIDLADPYRAPEARAAGSPPFLRQALDTPGLLACFVVATLPAWAVGVWNTGRRGLEAGFGSEGESWQLGMLAAFRVDADPTAMLACLTLGVLYFIPLLAAVLATSAFWALVFARTRQGGVDPGWLFSGWLMVLLMPPSTPLTIAVLAASFGVVLGSHIFGGTGKYLISPALLGVLFLHFSYPELVQTPLAAGDAGSADGWRALAAGGEDVVEFLLGREPGGLATGSALACAVGALYLVRVGAASWRTIAGAVVGFLVSATVVNVSAGEDPAWHVPWYAHMAVGYVAFGVAFLATDPSAAPLTRPARWAHGLLIGVLTVVIRVLDPTHPEGSLYALLLAGLSVPFLDYLVVRRYRTRVRIRAQLRTRGL